MLSPAFFTLLFYFYKPLNLTRRYWAILNLFIGLWGLGLVTLFSFPSQYSLYISRFLNHVAINIPITFLYFIDVFTSQNNTIKKTTKILLIITIVYLLLSIIFQDLFIPTTHTLLNTITWPSAGPLFYFFPIHYFLTITYSLYLLAKYYKTSSGKKKTNTKYILIGISLGYLGGFTTFLPTIGININPTFGLWLVVVNGIILSYSIIKHQLMDIRIVLRRSLIYSLLIGIITLIYLLTVVVLENLIKKSFGYSSSYWSIFIAFSLGIGFIPLRNKIQNIVDKIIFNKTQEEFAEENELLRQEVSRTEKLKSIATLASGMAHEIKNPLTTIHTFTEYLPQKINDKEFLLKFSDLVSKEVNRINDLVHDLLEYAKPTPPNRSEENIYNLLNETLDLLTSQIVKHRIKLIKKYDSNHPLLLNIDKNQIKQVFLNIILNAIDAMPKRGVLTIETSSFNNHESFSIKIYDSGHGISQKDLTKIFDPFYTLKDTGTGLGLPISHEIIKQHNGAILINSTPSKGTCVEIALPLN